MKLKERIKCVGFWTGLFGALFLILGAFGVEIGDDTASAIVNSVCSLLVVFGIVSAPQAEEVGGADEQSSDDEEEKNAD